MAPRTADRPVRTAHPRKKPVRKKPTRKPKPASELHRLAAEIRPIILGTHGKRIIAMGLDPAEVIQLVGLKMAVAERNGRGYTRSGGKWAPYVCMVMRSVIGNQLRLRRRKRLEPVGLDVAGADGPSVGRRVRLSTSIALHGLGGFADCTGRAQVHGEQAGCPDLPWAADVVKRLRDEGRPFAARLAELVAFEDVRLDVALARVKREGATPEEAEGALATVREAAAAWV